jgi:hypothetical protein
MCKGLGMHEDTPIQNNLQGRQNIAISTNIMLTQSRERSQSSQLALERAVSCAFYLRSKQSL